MSLPNSQPWFITEKHLEEYVDDQGGIIRTYSGGRRVLFSEDGRKATTKRLVIRCDGQFHSFNCEDLDLYIKGKDGTWFQTWSERYKKDLVL